MWYINISSYLYRLLQCDCACSLTRVHSVLVYVSTRYLSNSIKPPRLIHCYAVEPCHSVSWPLYNMADWTGKMEVPVPPSTKGCNKYLSYLPVYISHIDHLLSDQKYMYSYNISTFNFFIIMQEIILIQRLCPDDLFICLQYISHILYIYTCQIIFHNFGT